VRSLNPSIGHHISGRLGCLESRPRPRGGLTALQTSRLIRKLSIESQKVEKLGIEVSIA
jgi:hypothetical protein